MQIDLRQAARQTPRRVVARLQLVPAIDARSSLAERHTAVLRSVALKLTRNPTEADDLVQDTFERCLAATGSKPDNERAWLLSILNHLFIDRCRKLAREGTAVEVEAEALPVAVPDLEPRWARMEQSHLDAAVRQLEAGFRDAYRLHVEGQSYAQISNTLRIPQATVGTRLLRARQKLRSLLFPESDDE